MKYDVFISYSSNDQKVVEGLSAYLENNGIRCFVAYRDIPRGVVWAEAIADAIDESRMMVVVFSKSFNDSPEVDREITLCSEDQKPILTFRLSDTAFKGAKKYYLKNLNWIDAFPEPEKYFGALLNSTQKLLGRENKAAQTVESSHPNEDRLRQEQERLQKEKAELEKLRQQQAEQQRLEDERKRVQAEKVKIQKELEAKRLQREQAQLGTTQKGIDQNKLNKIVTSKWLWLSILAIAILAAIVIIFISHDSKDDAISNIEMVYVEGGTFTMGCTGEQGSDCYDWESPAHQVTVSSFYMGKYEVTQAQWKAVMGSNPSYFKGDNLPVENVSWNDVQEFIRKLNAQTGKTYRLPTEAEWEYAARGGNKSKGYKYSGSNTLGNVAWYTDNSGSSTHAVGTKSPNESGIYDMSGNVWEWCQDWYGSYSSSAQRNPTGPASGSYRVLRGGGWFGSAGDCRVSFRSYSTPDDRDGSYGFRLVLVH